MTRPRRADELVAGDTVSHRSGGSPQVVLTVRRAAPGTVSVELAGRLGVSTWTGPDWTEFLVADPETVSHPRVTL